MGLTAWGAPKLERVSNAMAARNLPDLDKLNRRYGTDFRYVGIYQGGEVGAVRLLDASRAHYALKAQPAGLAPATTEALRALGYPAPRYVIWEDSYCVQEELP